MRSWHHMVFLDSTFSVQFVSVNPTGWANQLIVETYQQNAPKRRPCTSEEGEKGGNGRTWSSLFFVAVLT